MKAIERVLRAGYFPKELPPPFTTESFAACVSRGLPQDWALNLERPTIKKPAFVSTPAIHNLARAGTLRRKLSIPNPVNQYQVTQAIVDGWRQIKKVTDSSTISLTTPIYGKKSGVRPISPKAGFSEMPTARAKTRAGARYILTTDLNSFYPSIYTHSIPWALHGKDIAKANRKNTLLGNKLDLAIRNGQSQQTIGIPIGPDTSLVIAEVLASAVDQKLSEEVRRQAFRYIDDFECGFMTTTAAERNLSEIQNLYADYELSLNPRKTKIIELPYAIEASWIPNLRLFSFGSGAQRTEILGFFGQAFELAAKGKEEAILKYAIQRMRSVVVEEANWDMYEDILLGCLSAESGTTPAVVAELVRYRDVLTISKSKIERVLDSQIKHHAPQHHGSEVAWSLWLLANSNFDISAEAAQLAMAIPDPIVALTLLHGRHGGLIKGTVDWRPLEQLMTKEALLGPNWLLAYEANVKGWLPSKGSPDNVGEISQFQHLKQNGVVFYDPAAALKTAPTKARPFAGKSGSESIPTKYPASMPEWLKLDIAGDEFEIDDEDEDDDNAFDFGLSG